METKFTNTEDLGHSVIEITYSQFEKECQDLAGSLKWSKYDSIYPVPKNGMYIAHKLSEYSGKPIVFELNKDSLVVDDIIDSGRTISKYENYDKAVLFVKRNKQYKNTFCYKTVGNDWIKFPWEYDDLESHISRLLEFIGEDPNREGLIDTPMRVVKSWQTIYGGYKEDPQEILSRTFSDDYILTDPIVLKNIEFYSTCEHHMLPFFGHISIGYVPDKKIVGVSKLARIVDCFSRRLQIQERLTDQIAEHAYKILEAKFVIVHCEAQHFCVVSRGVRKEDAVMVTMTTKGVDIDQLYERKCLEMFR